MEKKGSRKGRIERLIADAPHYFVVSFDTSATKFHSMSLSAHTMQKSSRIGAILCRHSLLPELTLPATFSTRKKKRSTSPPRNCIFIPDISLTFPNSLCRRRVMRPVAFLAIVLAALVSFAAADTPAVLAPAPAEVPATPAPAAEAVAPAAAAPAAEVAAPATPVVASDNSTTPVNASTEAAAPAKRKFDESKYSEGSSFVLFPLFSPHVFGMHLSSSPSAPALPPPSLLQSSPSSRPSSTRSTPTRPRSPAASPSSRTTSTRLPPPTSRRAL